MRASEKGHGDRRQQKMRRCRDCEPSACAPRPGTRASRQRMRARRLHNGKTRALYTRDTPQGRGRPREKYTRRPAQHPCILPPDGATARCLHAQRLFARAPHVRPLHLAPGDGGAIRVFLCTHPRSRTRLRHGAICMAEHAHVAHRAVHAVRVMGKARACKLALVFHDTGTQPPPRGHRTLCVNANTQACEQDGAAAMSNVSRDASGKRYGDRDAPGVTFGDGAKAAGAVSTGQLITCSDGALPRSQTCRDVAERTQGRTLCASKT